MLSSNNSRQNYIPYYLIWIFIVLSLSIGITGYLYYKNQKIHAIEEKQNELASIADLKVRQIVDWRRERIGDAEFIFENSKVGRRISAFLENPDRSGLKQEIMEFMKSFEGHNQYKSILLIDKSVNLRLSTSKISEKLEDHIREMAVDAMRSGKVYFADLHKSEKTDEIHMGVFVPVMVSEKGKARAVGVFLLMIDPHRFLYDLIQSWPGPNETAETLLVRREGDEVVFLNDLRHKKNTALSLRFPVTQKHLPAAMAVLGKEGIVEGIDYRNVPVIAFMRKIPGSPWFIVAKVDKKEIYGPVQRGAWLVFIISFVSVIAAGLSVVLWWRQQRLMYYRRQYETEEARKLSEQKYQLLNESIMDGFVSIGMDGTIMEFNRAYKDMIGYSEKEIYKLTYFDITPKKWHDFEAEIIENQILKRGFSDIYEKEYTRKDGTIFPVEFRTYLIKDRNGEPSGMWGIVRDITERKLVQQERDITIEFLSLVNKSTEMKNLVQAAAMFFQKQSGCEAVGIRLHEGEDYPYFEARGFPEEFVLMENSLCAKDSANCVIRDNMGNPVIECMCGNVICGRFDPSKSFFTPHGSFWTNSTTQLLASTTEADRQSRTRNRCNGEGYESVALIPLRFGEQRLGLLQLNDRRKEVFSLAAIGLWERLADQLAIALAKFRTEDALHESEERYHSLFDNMLEGFAYCKMLFESGRPQDFIYLDINNAFEKLTGLKDVVGKKVSDVIPGIRESDPKLLELYGRVAMTGQPEKFEVFVKALNTWFNISVYSPKKEHFVAVFDVITGRKQLEEALIKSEKNYRSLVDNALVGVYRSNLEGRFLYVNEAMAGILEYGTTEEMLTEDVTLRYKDPWDRKILVDVLQEKGKLSNYEVEVTTKSGGTKNILISATLERDLISGMIIDLTDQRKLEEQLRQSQKIEAVGQLAGGIAHDFNNILSAIMGYSSFMQMEMKADDPLMVHVEQILEAAERAATLTHSLLAFSRKQVMNLKPVDINSIIKKMEKFLVRIIGEDIELRTRLREGSLVVLADSGQMEQVFLNLATNARDAMPKGGNLDISSDVIEMDSEFIKVHGYGGHGKYLFVSVTDTGIGMDEETKQKIFEPFFTTKEVGRGTGLGLSMVYGIIKQHNGYINVYSEPGKGTTFKIYLPVIEAKVEKEKPATAAPYATGGTETILVAEDDESLRKLSRTVLEAFGYKIITAEDGEDAVKKFMENKDEISLCIFDMIMPKMSGMDAYNEIRKVKADVRVLFASGYTADIVHKKEFIEDGLDFILKPILPKNLLTKVREILDKNN